MKMILAPYVWYNEQNVKILQIRSDEITNYLFKLMQCKLTAANL